MLRVIRVFVRIQYACDTGQVQCSGSDDHELQPAYDVVYSFCEEFILNPRVIEFTEIRKLLCDEANKLGIDVPQSHSKNLVRKISCLRSYSLFLTSKTRYWYIPAHWKCEMLLLITLS